MKSLLCILIAALLFVSCDEDKPADPPTVFITPNFGNTNPGGVLTPSIEIDAPGGMASLRVTTIVEEVRDDVNATTIIPTTLGITDTTFTYTFDETDKSLAGLIIDLEFVVADLEAQTDTSLYRIGISEPGVKLVTGTSFTHPQSDGAGGSNSSTFFTTSNAQPLWTINQIDNDDTGAEIDFGYYYDDDAGSAIFASIEDFPIANFGGMDTWSRRNSTEFRMTDMTASEFDDAFFKEIYEAFTNGTAFTRQQRTDGLSVGDVVAFETNADKEEGSKVGIILVTDLQAGDGSSDFIQVKITYEEQLGSGD